MVDWDSELQNVMIDYFDSLFKASNAEWDHVIECVESRITDEQNNDLLKEVTETEVKAALFYMYPDKSPGPGRDEPGILSETLANCWAGYSHHCQAFLQYRLY